MNSKAKGNKYERDVARFLTRWITGKDNPLLFWRSTSSGAFWTTSRCAEGQAGDISAVHVDGQWFIDQYTIECKSVAPIKFDLGHTGDLEKFWGQAINQARGIDREPLLFLKRNNRKELFGCSARIGRFFTDRLSASIVICFAEFKPEPLALFLTSDVQGVPFSEFKKFTETN